MRNEKLKFEIKAFVKLYGTEHMKTCYTKDTKKAQKTQNENGIMKSLCETLWLLSETLWNNTPEKLQKLGYKKHHD